MSHSNEDQFQTTINEDIFLLQFSKYINKLEEEPDSEELDVLVYEHADDFANDCEIKIEETDIKKEIARDQNKSPEACGSRQIEAVVVDEQLCFLMGRDETNQNDNDREDDEYQSDVSYSLSDEEYIKSTKRHKKRSTISTKLYVCDVCNQGFTFQGNLSRHKRIHTGDKRIHTGDKRFICDVCNRGFTDSYHLGNHKRTHTGDKPYLCNVCNKGFTEQSLLTVHKRTHLDFKPFVCDVCNKGFTRPGDCEKHRRIHTGVKPYICDVCNKGFTDGSHLVKHRRIHTDDKPYVCDICNKGFRVSCHLVRHKSTHTRKPFLCDVCNKCFKRSSKLLEHNCIHIE